MKKYDIMTVKAMGKDYGNYEKHLGTNKLYCYTSCTMHKRIDHG